MGQLLRCVGDGFDMEDVENRDDLAHRSAGAYQRVVAARQCLLAIYW